MLDDAAALAVCSWRFTPATMGGTSIAVAMTITVEFPDRLRPDAVDRTGASRLPTAGCASKTSTLRDDTTACALTPTQTALRTRHQAHCARSAHCGTLAPCIFGPSFRRCRRRSTTAMSNARRLAQHAALASPPGSAASSSSARTARRRCSTRTEADRVIAAARDAVPRDRPLIAGTGRESTRATIAATRRAAGARRRRRARAHAGLLQGQMPPDAFVAHYTAVADASPVPVLLYNFTAVTGVNLLPASRPHGSPRIRTSSA